jgi:hypothetical protein
MGKSEFETASNNLYSRMIYENELGIMQYQPFSDNFWTNKPKIVICNYENFGYYRTKEISTLTFKEFEWWFDERKNKAKRGKSKTVHYSVIFINILLMILKEHPLITFTLSDSRKLFWKYDEIFKNMINIMYMNLRPTSASGNQQEIGKTNNIVNKYKNELKDYILSHCCPVNFRILENKAG